MELNSFPQIEAAVEKAEEKRKRGDLLGAYQSYYQIFSTRLSATKFIAADLSIIQSLADLAIFFGDFQIADDLLTALTSLCEEEGNIHRADYARLKHINLALDWGDPRQADRLFEDMSPRIGKIRKIQISPSGLVQWERSCSWSDTDSQDRTVLFSQLYLAMGRLLSALGQYGDAIKMFNRGFIHTQTQDSSASRVPSLAEQNAMPLKLGITSAYLEQGNMETAKANLAILRNALNEREHPVFFVRWLELSGKMSLLCGEFGQALENFKRVQEVCHHLGAKRAVLKGTLNLAHVLILLNQTSLAKDYLLDAQADAQTYEDQELINRTKLLMCMAHARGQSLVPGSDSVKDIRQSHTNNVPDVVDNQQHNFFLTTQSANYLALFEDRVLSFHWFLSHYNLATVANLFTQIKEAFGFSDSILIRLKIRIIEGILAYYYGVENQGNNSRQYFYSAASILDEVRPHLRKLGLKAELWQVQRFLGWCLSRLESPVEEQEALAEETNELLTQLTESLSPEDQAIYLLNKWTADEEYIAAQINQLQRRQAKLRDGFFLLRPWRSWLLKQRLHNLMKHIDRYKDTLVKRTIEFKREDENEESRQNFTLWHRLFTHPRKRITLSFLILPDRVLAVRNGWFLFDFHVIFTTRLEIRNLVQRWHQSIEGKNGSRDLGAIPNEYSDESLMAELANQSRELAEQLSEMLKISSLLEKLPKRVRAITIVPDDILHGFPFGIIRHRGNYLIKHYALSIAYESSFQKTPQPTQIDKGLIVGVSQAIEHSPPLPAIRKELEHVKHWLDRHNIKTIRLDDNQYNPEYQPHKQTVLKRLSVATLLHIACHGIFESNRPDLSGLVLISSSGEKDILSFRELSQLDLKPLRHATLSSCWSADHFMLPGRWIISLPETLWRAGTQSILGCLWEVDDGVAVSFMTHFYNYLDKLPRDEALRQTQLDCLENNLSDCENVDTTNPIFWAGFSLYGDYRKFSKLEIDPLF